MLMDLTDIAIYLVVALQVADLVTTVIALRNPRLGESNSVLRWLFERLGVIPTLVIVKGAVIALLVFGGREMGLPILAVLTVLYVWVVVNNYRHIIKE